MAIPNYILPLKLAFEDNRNPALAQQMKAYVRDLFDFYGIKAPVRKNLVQQHKQRYGLMPEEQKKDIVLWCWNQPEREFQYAAMDLLGGSAKHEPKPVIELYHTMIIKKSWWDTVDFISSNLVGVYFKQYPEAIPSVTEAWMSSGNIWLQRSCLLFQLKYKTALDTVLLEGFIDRLSTSKEFFIRKAIGWMLREYSITNPEYVAEFVSRTTLSGLSRKEAMRRITKWYAER